MRVLYSIQWREKEKCTAGSEKMRENTPQEGTTGCRVGQGRWGAETACARVGQRQQKVPRPSGEKPAWRVPEDEKLAREQQAFYLPRLCSPGGCDGHLVASLNPLPGDRVGGSQCPDSQLVRNTQACPLTGSLKHLPDSFVVVLSRNHVISLN